MEFKGYGRGSGTGRPSNKRRDSRPSLTAKLQT